MAPSLRCTPSRLTFLLLAALFFGLVHADGADNVPVFFSPVTVDPQPTVRYQLPLRIATQGLGRFESEFDESNNTYYERLTAGSNRPGDIQILVSTSGESSPGDPVYLNDSVYVAVLNRSPQPAPLGWWGWRQEGESQWFLVETSRDKRAEFKVTRDGLRPCILINFCYALRSCPPGSSCGNLAPYEEDGAVYVQLGGTFSKRPDLTVIFHQAWNAITMPTDA